MIAPKKRRGSLALPLGRKCDFDSFASSIFDDDDPEQFNLR
jgi:hypothetical protein